MTSKECRKSVRRKASGSHELKRLRTRVNNVLEEAEERMRVLHEEEDM